MPRAKGQRSAGYESRRISLLSRARLRLARANAMRPSWRELAAGAGAGLSTLTHYFGRRDALVAQVLHEDLRRSGDALAELAAPSGPFARSVREAVEQVAAGFQTGGEGEVYALGLVEGLRHETLGPAFVTDVLEPRLRALEARLSAHVREGEMREGDTRGAALALLAPVAFAFLHQDELMGHAAHPMDVEAFLRRHAKAFVRAHRARD